jgi:uncharacterized membrane protein YkvI
MTLLALFLIVIIALVIAAFFAESSTDTYTANIQETDPWNIDWASEDF